MFCIGFVCLLGGGITFSIGFVCLFFGGLMFGIGFVCWMGDLCLQMVGLFGTGTAN